MGVVAPGEKNVKCNISAFQNIKERKYSEDLAPFILNLDTRWKLLM